jgi:SprB repeat
MSKSIRIRTTPLGEDKHLKIKIDQDFDLLEVLSLKITQEEAYRRFCSDYGVLVGRVVVNNGFGIPNAKISVFIPISEEDKLDPFINSTYPYESVYGKDSNGVRYNLLGNFFKDNNPCYIPVGTIGNKREILDCDTKLEVFEKYYKYTTTTNSSGDYMIFGIPVGEQTIHLDVDLSDIGYASQKPYELIAQGYNKKQFISNTQFKKSTNLDNLPQIKSRNSSTSIIPFWGDLDECEVGITRLDFDLNHTITPTAILMGSVIADVAKHGVNKNCRPKPNMGLMKTLKTGSGTIEIIRKNQDGSVEQYVPQGESSDINDDGVYCFQMPMNLEPVITDEFGNQVPSEDPSIGLPTKAKIRMRTKLNDSQTAKKFRTATHLTPNRTNDYSFGQETPDEEFAELLSRKIYTTKQFIVRYQKGSAANKRSRTSIKAVDEDLTSGVNPFPYNRIDPEVNPLFSFLCLFVFIFLTLVTSLNGIIIPALNFVIGLLNSVLSIICVVLFYVVGIVIGSIIGVINLLPRINLPGGNYCDYCLKKDSCNGLRCQCDEPILPYIPCVVLSCNEQRYAPGCSPICKDGAPFCDPNVVEGLGYSLGQGYCAAGKPEHYGPIVPSTTSCVSCAHDFTSASCNNTTNDGHNLANFYGYYDCFQSQLAKALNLYKLDFYNDYINGVLYFYAFKIKTRTKKKKSIEVFCDYDCHDSVDSFESDAEGPEHIKNDCTTRNNLLETCVDQGVGSLANNEISQSISEGLIKDYQGEKYYPAYNHGKNFLMFASDILCLGSMLDCDIDGSRKIIDKLESTTYQIPVLSNETNEDGQLEETGADPLLYNIRCTAPQCYVTKRNCANIRKICEYGVGLDELREEYILDDDGNVVSTITTQPDCKIDICNNTEPGFDLENYDVRNEIAYVNGVSRTLSGDCTSIYTNYTGYLAQYLEADTSNEYFGDIRFLNNRKKNSYYFYFGLYDGKTALDCVINNYFTPCYNLNTSKNIAINVNKVDNICFGQNNGKITIKIINGTSPWVYTIIGPSYITTQTFNTNGNLIELDNLLSGSYQITITDSLSNSSTYLININDPSPLNATPIIIDTTSPLVNNGSISLLTYNGNPPYTYTWTPTPPNNQNGSTITGLSVGDYSVIITDTALSNTCPSQTFVLTGLTIGSPSGLYFRTKQTNVKCNGGNDGQITIDTITGGTSPYTYYLNGSPMQTTTINGLTAGTYNIVVYDSTSAQTSTQNVTIIQPTIINATLNGGTINCYGCTTTLTFNNVSGGVPPYSYFVNTPNPNQNANQQVTVGAGTYEWYVKDSNGCKLTGTTTVSQPSQLKITNLNTTNANCYNGTGGATFNVVGGTSPYTYRIFNSVLGADYYDNATPCNVTSQNPNILGSSNTCLVNLPNTSIVTPTTPVFGGSVTFNNPVTLSDQYYIEVKDNNGCTACATFTLYSPPQLNLSLIKSLVNPSPLTYSILAIGSGGETSSGNYTYRLYNNSNCAGSPSETKITGSNCVFDNSGSGYISGNYSVQIEDDNGCLKCVNITL